MIYTKEQVVDIIQKQGLGYAIQSYMRGKDIKDRGLAIIWDDAKDLLDRISEYVGLR